MQDAARLSGCTYLHRFNQVRALSLDSKFDALLPDDVLTTPKELSSANPLTRLKTLDAHVARTKDGLDRNLALGKLKARYGDPRRANQINENIETIERIQLGDSVLQRRIVNPNPEYIPRLGNGRWGENGICYGLAVAWLDAVVAGEQDGFLDNVQGPESSLINRAHLLYQLQAETAETDGWLRLTRLVPAKDGNDEHKTKKVAFDQLHALANWLKSAARTRYFLLNVQNHAMAAVGSATNSWFFDPNGGVVQTRFASKLGAFFAHYFGNEKIRNAYKNNGHDHFILAEKYKKADSSTLLQRQKVTPKVYPPVSGDD